MIKLNQTLVAGLILLGVLTACGGLTDDRTSAIEDKLFQWEEKGWKSQSTTHYIGGIAYAATLVPLQYYIIKNEGSQNLLNIDSIYQANKTERIIEVEFEDARGKDLFQQLEAQRTYTDAVKYMSSSIAEDFHIMLPSGEKVNCVGVTFERNYQMTPFKRVLLYFSGIPEDSPVQLVYNDQLFGNSLIQFDFKETPIQI